MADKWVTNNFVISVLNAAMRNMVEKLGIEFTDVFRMEYICKNYLAKLGNDTNPNHYLCRTGNQFYGDVGEAVYFGDFLPRVCQQIMS
jgi:hypothetical protein